MTKKVKLKTHSGAAKRFKKTGTGRIKRKNAFKNHILTKKSVKRKRHLREVSEVSPGDSHGVNVMLGDC